jgi:hypothetical protein
MKDPKSAIPIQPVSSIARPAAAPVNFTQATGAPQSQSLGASLVQGAGGQAGRGRYDPDAVMELMKRGQA